MEECSSNADCNDGNANAQDECVNNNCINTPLACIQNNIECGIDGFIGSNFCLNNNVYGLFLNFTCSNNQCSYSASNLLIDDCLYGCSNGVCITAPPIECSLNSECNDNNARTADECVNPGQTNSYCMNTEVDCIIDTDCGITGFINDNFCSNNDIYRIFQTATCENPGTLQSNCMITAEQTLITDCNDNNPLTFDWCTNSQCSHNYPQCSDGLDNDGARYVDYPADAGCTSQLDDNETNIIQTYPQCSDGLDNDGDGLVDYPSDPACSSQLDNDESPYNAFQCSDGIDNDGDKFTDYPNDLGCISRFDNSESPYNYHQCSDGLDNDGDRYVDYPADAGCSSQLDNTE